MTEIDSATTARFESLHPNARVAFRLRALLLSLLLAVALAMPPMLLIAFVAEAEAIALWGWLAAACWLVVVPFCCRHAERQFRRTRYAFDASGLTVRRGVWFRRETRIARARIQHIDLDRGPLDRRLGIATLRLHTAGTRLVAVELAGLDARRALEMRDHLLAEHGA